jgi:uncharacterized membrane protein YphA (DoxX/SURF4 family)
MPTEQASAWAERTAKEVLLIRILAGWVFLSEGIQKFLFPDSLGVGRFVKIGIPLPQIMAPFVCKLAKKTGVHPKKLGPTWVQILTN